VPDPGDGDRLYQLGVMLLNGWGYNWYREDNRRRADDLLIRSRASEHLANAAAHLRDLEGRYRRKYLPPPTRQNPSADPQHLATARAFRAVAERIGEVDTKLRSAAVPPDDKVWLRRRGELDMLKRLGECDAVLVAGAKELADLVAGLPAADALDPAIEVQIDRHLDRLGEMLARRAAILAGEGHQRGGFGMGGAPR
jgi:hypothetical protein